MIVHPVNQRIWEMNELESQEATADVLVDLAKQRGVELGSLRYDTAFFSEERYIWLWQKEGKVRYNMQGRIDVLPEKMKDSASAFHGMWGETGTFDTIEQALEFVKAWLIDQKEVDDLPQRSIRSYGI
jgi:hypothetical protein